jgi:hypothetical protein
MSLLACALLHGATVYVKPGAANPTTAVQYKVGASSCDEVGGWTDSSTLQATLSQPGVGGTLNICPGTYSGAMLAATGALFVPLASSPGLTINGVGTVIIDGAGRGAEVLKANYVFQLNNVTLKNADAGRANLFLDVNSGGSTITNVHLEDGHNALFVGNTSGTVTLNRLEMSGHANSAIVQGVGGTMVFNYPVFRDSAASSYTFRVNKSTAVTLNNPTFIRNRKVAVYVADATAGTVTLNNPLFVANDYRVEGVADVDAGYGATVTLNYPAVWRGPYYGLARFRGAGTITVNDEVTGASPKLERSARTGVASFQIDDSSYLSNGWFSTIAGIAMSEYGFPMAIALSTIDMTPDLWASLRALVLQGHDVSAHTRRHVAIGGLDAFAVQYTGTGSSAVLSVGSGRITTTITGGPGGENLDVALTGTAGNACTAIAASGPYTCTITAIRAAALAADLATVAAQDIKTAPYTVAFDPALLFAEEILGSKADIEANIGIPGYQLKTFIAPNCDSSAEAQAYMLSSGYLLARGRPGYAGSYDLSNLTTFNTFNLLASDLGTTPEEIQYTVGSILEWAKERGAFISIYAHSEAQFSADQWRVIFATAKASGIPVMTLSQAADHIVGNATGVLPAGSTTDGGLTWTRTFTDNSNFRLRYGSPLIDAGADVGLTTDFDGITISGAPDIGASDYKVPKRRRVN